MRASFGRSFVLKTIFSVMVITSCTATGVFGAVIKLTSGNIVAGIITERDDESIKIDTGYGIPITYFLDEISTIDGQPAIPVAVIEKKAEDPLRVKDIPAAPTPEIADTIVETKILEKPVKPEAPKKNVAPQVKAEPKRQEVTETELPQTPDVSPPEDVADNEITATLDEVDVFKEQTSPAQIKPKEAPKTVVKIDLQEPPEENSKKVTAAESESGNASQTGFLDKIFRYFRSYKYGFKETSSYVRDRWPDVKEFLYIVPVSIRRDALIVTLSALAILYIFVCFPIMQIARMMGRKHAWLIWIPFVQVVYLIYIAKQPYWLSVFFFVPILNVFVPLMLFFDILRLLKKPRWLIAFLTVPGVNVFTLWYLSMSKANQSLE